jgi:hypothetical protein
VTTPRSAEGVFWWYATENASPRVTAAFLARQRRLLLPAQYAREHENAWVDAADSFTTAAEVDAAMATGWTEQAAGLRGIDYEAFVDLGAVHDPTVVCVGHAEPGGLVVIDRLDTLRGSREAPVKIAHVEARIRDLAAQFSLARCRVESWQGLALVQALGALGAELFAPSARSNAEEWPILAQHLGAGTLVLFPHARLREELLNLSYELGPTGVRVLDRRAVPPGPRRGGARRRRLALGPGAGGRGPEHRDDAGRVRRHPPGPARPGAAAVAVWRMGQRDGRRYRMDPLTESH